MQKSIKLESGNELKFIKLNRGDTLEEVLDMPSEDFPEWVIESSLTIVQRGLAANAVEFHDNAGWLRSATPGEFLIGIHSEDGEILDVVVSKNLSDYLYNVECK